MVKTSSINVAPQYVWCFINLMQTILYLRIINLSDIRVITGPNLVIMNQYKSAINPIESRWVFFVKSQCHRVPLGPRTACGRNGCSAALSPLPFPVGKKKKKHPLMTEVVVKWLRYGNVDWYCENPNYICRNHPVFEHCSFKSHQKSLNHLNIKKTNKQKTPTSHCSL